MVTKTAKNKSPEKATTSAGMQATLRTLTKMGVSGEPQPVGAIPLWDGKDWRWVFNSASIPSGAENCADPTKVEALRRTVVSVLNPETIAQLESIGCRVKSLINTPIRAYKDIVRWSESIFNWGPGDPAPYDVMKITHDDFQPHHIETSSILVPMGPRGSGDNRVRVIATNDEEWARKLQRGHEVVLGPRHEISKGAFALQVETQKAAELAQKAAAKKTVDPSAPYRGRGRPRKDGLLPGTPEAVAANEAYKAGQPLPEWVQKKMGVDPHKYERRPTRRQKKAADPVKKAPARKKAAAKKAAAKVIHIETAPTKRRKIRRVAHASAGA